MSSGLGTKMATCDWTSPLMPKKIAMSCSGFKKAYRERQKQEKGTAYIEKKRKRKKQAYAPD